MYTIVLTIFLFMPPPKHDGTRDITMESIEQCLDTAKSWLELDPKEMGGIGLAAGCAKQPVPGQDAQSANP